METKETGTCKHGEFDLMEGCPQCIDERRQQEIRPEQDEMEDGLNSEGLTLAKPQIVKVKYYNGSGILGERPYTYYSAEPLEVGDIVIVPVRDTTGKAQVSAINVPETEIAAFKDKVKTIPAGAAKQAFVESNDNEPYLPDDGVITTAPPGPLGGVTAIVSPAGHVTIIDTPEPATAIALRPGEDIEVRGHYDTAVSLLKYATKLTVTTLEDSKLATSDLASIATCKKAMEAKRKEKLAPSKKETEDINATYKDLMVPVLEAEQILKGKQLAFLTEQRRIQTEQERINQQRLEAAQAEMKLTGEMSESLVEIEVVNAPKSVHGVIGSSGMVDHWTAEVVNDKLVPREYLIVDMAQLNWIAKQHHDSKPVDGVNFVNKPYLATRR